MAKPYPEMITLRCHQCPVCKEKRGMPELTLAGATVQAVCPKDGCPGRWDVFWLGDAQPSRN